VAAQIEIRPSDESEEQIAQALADCRFWQMVEARAQLPRLLADLVAAGRTEEVLKAIVEWGNGRKPVTQIWKEVRNWLASSCA